MTIPNLPPEGDTSWYDWATSLDTEARKVAGKLDTATASATYAAKAGAVYTGAHDFTGATVTGIAGGGGTSNVVDGTAAGQVPVWDPVDARYEPVTPAEVVAADVPFTPTGTIAATNVQAAIAEVASEAGAGSALVVQDENANVATAVTQIDFQGAGVTTTLGTGEVIVTIPGGSGGTITTQDEGVALSTAVTTLNFTGAGVTASGAAGTTTVNIPGGGGTSVVTSGSISRLTTTQAIAATTTTDIAFNATGYNVGGVVGPSSASLVVPAGKAGLWELRVAARWDSVATAMRVLNLNVNGATVADNRTLSSNSNSVQITQQVARNRVLAVGDSVTASVFASSAGNLQAIEGATWLEATYLGPTA